MKIIYYCLLLLIATPINAQSDNKAQLIKGIKFEGYIFPKSNIIDADWMPLHEVKERYTPTAEDITTAEEILTKQLKGTNTQLVNQRKGCPVIHENLKKYKRQYFGYINNSGEKIIWINLVWGNKENSSDLDKKVRVVLDGCSYYWNIKVNLNEGKLFDLIVNGSA